MIDKYNEIINAFDEEREKEESNIINEKINASKKHLASLLSNNDKLKSTIADLEFKIIESEVETKAIYDQIGLIQKPTSEASKGSSAFFNYLTSLEEQEESLLVNIESSKKTFQELYHQRNKQIQARDGLSRRVDSKKLQLMNMKDENRNLNDLIGDLQMTIDQKENEYRESVLASVRLQNELENKSCTVIGQNKSITELKYQYSEAQKLLKIKQKELKEVERQIEQSEHEYQKAFERRIMEKNKISSVNHWKYGRTDLVNKLKKAKEEYYMILSNLDFLHKKEAKLNEKLKESIGISIYTDIAHGGFNENEDPSHLLLQYLQTDINEMSGIINPENSEEIKVEQDYNRELNHQLNVIEKSLNNLKNFKDELIRSLNKELSGCYEDGYIKLIESEMNELKMEKVY